MIGLIQMAIEVTVDATIDYAILNFRRLINRSEKKEVESLNLANLNYRLAKLTVENYNSFRLPCHLNS